MREKYPQYTGILTIDPDGKLFCNSLQPDRTLDLNDRSYFRQARIAKDVVQLSTALLNLAINARDAIPGGGSASRISLSQEMV